jgi:hypothetical protein
MLGICREKAFMKNFMAGARSIHEAVSNYVKAVKTENSGPEHAFDPAISEVVTDICPAAAFKHESSSVSCQPWQSARGIYHS